MVSQTSLFDPQPKTKPTYSIPSKWIRERAGEGCTCPACGQFVKIYRRTITSAMAKALILFYKYFRTHPYTESIHSEGYLKRCRTSCATRGDVGKLVYWGFLQKAKKSGHYHWTAKAQRFVLGMDSVQKTAIVYNGVVDRLEGPEITIKEALKAKFSYSELMAQKVEV